jgi:hypothetical protein
MDTIVRLMGDRSAVFDPGDIQAMSIAFEDVCRALDIKGDMTAREVIATRIIELTRRGERSPTELRDRVLAEARGGTGC